MPFMMRPKVKKLTKEITSPKSAFIIGFLVTIFLLPCTIGPYIIATGLLYELGFISVLPWLLYYNFIFVLPMVAIVFIVYFGFAKVEDVSGWKERNIRRLHLTAGILLFIIGLMLVMGWL
jgi:cytochrome c biogenesis protein CcdA